ncbi:hypothetical protein [Virgibacillus sp. 6R]|uniref:hypothetical protein n=1 Tax=Virgibacillus sp. 6R TaxID=1911587 RepID=UPI0012EB6048|nr:hypothetical protein [Virgibacillus sp. 6R]MBS7428234.1 hypothetical protein [Virgibacillus sp. 19R1-5]
MNRLNSTDLLAFVLMTILLLEIDFNNMTTLSWIGLVVSVLWFILFIIKIILPAKEKK